jgi:hypothetical protein
VGCLEPAADLDRIGGGLVERQPAETVDALLERLALDVLEERSSWSGWSDISRCRTLIATLRSSVSSRAT